MSDKTQLLIKALSQIEDGTTDDGQEIDREGLQDIANKALNEYNQFQDY